jgi:proprotein convertase subtilisin/kexin type 5
LQTYIYLSTNCISCDSQIINCYNCYYSATAANTLCTICSTGYYLLSNGTCTNVCTNGLYISQSKYCLPCGSYCSVCTSDSVCQTCINNYVLYQSKCYTICPIGYYNNLGVCS